MMHVIGFKDRVGRKQFGFFTEPNGAKLFRGYLARKGYPILEGYKGEVSPKVEEHRIQNHLRLEKLGEGLEARAIEERMKSDKKKSREGQ